jgi:hypothetical protein
MPPRSHTTPPGHEPPGARTQPGFGIKDESELSSWYEQKAGAGQRGPAEEAAKAL